MDQAEAAGGEGSGAIETAAALLQTQEQVTAAAKTAAEEKRLIERNVGVLKQDNS